MRLLLLFMLTVLALVLRGGEIFDFARLSDRIELVHYQKGSAAKVGKIDGRDALELFFDPARNSWNTIAIKNYQRPRLPLFRKCRIALEVWLPRNHAVRSVNLELCDSTGEMLQYPGVVSAQDHGWRKVAWEIDTASRAPHSWGGKKKNGVPDGKTMIRNFSCSFRSGGAAGSLAFGKVFLEVEEAPLEFGVATGNGFPVITRGREAEFGILLKNGNPVVRRGKAKWEISTANGDKLSAGGDDWEVAPRSEKVIPLPAPAAYGLYNLRVNIDGEQERKFRFGYMAPAGPVDGPIRGFVLGVCEHPESLSDEEAEVWTRAAALCGARVIRGAGSWNGIEWRKGYPDYHVEDTMVERLERYHMKMSLLLLGTPGWAVAKDWKPLMPGKKYWPMPDLDAWRKYVRTLASRWGDRLYSLEVWNEPDLRTNGNFTSREYFRMLKAANDAAKSVNPGLQIQSGGLAGIDLPASISADPRYAWKLLKDEAANYDVFALHNHQVYLGYEDMVGRFLKYRREARTGKPWYANEAAVTSSTVGDEKQAHTLFQKIIYTMSLMNRGAIGYNWYNLVEKTKYPAGHPERHFGLLTPELEPKAAYLAYNTVAGHFREAVPEREFSGPGDSFRLYCFKAANGDYLVPGWSVSDKRNKAILLAGITGPAVRVDLNGNWEPLAATNGGVLFTLSETPAFIRISGQKKAPLCMGAPLELPDTLILRGGEMTTLKAVLRNSGPKAVSLNVVADAPRGVLVRPRSIREPLAAGASRQVEFSVRAQDSFESGNLRFQVNPGMGVVSVRLERAVRLGDAPGLKHDLFLGERSQLVSMYPSAAETTRLQWQGAADLSGKFFLSARNQVLTIRCDVTDDRHRQRFSGSEIWQNDSLQIALTLPGQNTFWELGAALTDSGKAVGYCWRAPAGFRAEQAIEKIGVEVTRDEARKLTRYILKIPFDAVGLTGEKLGAGIRFNALINDCDETATRESYLRLAPGLGDGAASPELSVLIYQQEAEQK